jgi:hypothetical protein
MTVRVIARSEATKQSGASRASLDCFASLAMTVIDRAHQKRWVRLASIAILAGWTPKI